MNSYMHKNSAVEPPTMSIDAVKIYKSILDGSPIVLTRKYGFSDDLRALAERLDCDSLVSPLRKHGIDAAVVGRATPEITYYESAIRVDVPDAGIYTAMDADAASRVLQRVDNGLTPVEAINRTLEQCNRPVLTEHQLKLLENAADAVERRLMR
jgi:hypothetical protein